MFVICVLERDCYMVHENQWERYEIYNGTTRAVDHGRWDLMLLPFEYVLVGANHVKGAM